MSAQRPEPQRNPLLAKWQRRRDMRHEISYLQSLSDEEIQQRARQVSGFNELERIYSFWIDRSNPDTLQLSFGNRSMFRLTIDRSKTAAENGPTLVYSLGEIGFATILYPAKSDLARTFEDHVFLQIGATSGIKIAEGMERDLKILVAYAHVSSIDMTATLGERWRIWLLRQVCNRAENGKFRKAPSWSAMLGIAGFGARTFVTASFLSIIKPIGFAFALWVVAWLGWDWLKIT